MPRTLKTILNESNPSKLGAAGQCAKMGTLLALSPRYVDSAVASHVLTLPEAARAIHILHCYATAGTVTGQMTPIDNDGAPATTEVAVTPTGNIIFQATDAVTAAEVLYLMCEGAIYEETVVVATNVGTLLGSRSGRLLLEATALVGTTTGAETIVARGTTPATTQAALNDAGTGVVFAAADAVTRATIKYIAAPGIGSEDTAVVPELDVSEWLF